MKPNFFIVGAPKCATTAMSVYLSSHPDVFFSPSKEPFFFATDLDHRWRERRSLESYLGLFDGANGHKRVGEGSSLYLFSRVAARQIHTFNRDARILIMLRDPAEMIYSLHGQWLYAANENLTDFEAAIGAQRDRRRGKRIPPGAYFVEGLQYFAMARFSEQVARYFDVFGRDRVHITLQDDLRNDPVAALGAATDFLGLERMAIAPIGTVNKGRHVRFAGLRRIATHPMIRNLATLDRHIPFAPLRQRVAQLRRSVRQGVDALTAPVAARPDMRIETRRMLAEEFAPEIMRLSRMINRDLSHWCRAPQVTVAARERTQVPVLQVVTEP